jgi:putative DNA primase/helicase
MQRKQRLSHEEIDAALARARELYSTRPNAVHEAALGYVQRGWSVVPLPLAGTDESVGKKPTLKGWPNLRITTEAQVDQYFLNRLVNVGVILGAVSGNLVDVDHDCPEAIDLADQYLRHTGSVFGRASKPRSHRLYRCTGLALTYQFRDPIDESMIVELRGDTKSGQPGEQTVLPGSIHVLSGEPIEWEEDGEQPLIDYVELYQHVMNLAIGVLVARYCPGVRTHAEFQQALAKADPRVKQRIDFWQREFEKAASDGKSPPHQQHKPLAAGAATAAKDAPPPTEHEVTRLYTALTYTDSRDRMQVWLPFGGAIYDLAGWPEDLRRALWDWFSWHMDPAPEQWKKFDEADQEKTWASFGREYPGEPATVASIFHHALNNGWDGHTVKPLPDEIKALVPPPVEVPTSPAAAELMAEAQRLARMSYADCMLQPKKVAADLKVTLGDLDKLVRMIRKDENEPASRAAADARDAAEEAADLEQQRRDLELFEPEPWTQPVDGHELVLDIGLTLLRYVRMEGTEAFIIALWIVHTYIYDRFMWTPRLLITSPQMECGKTTLLKMISFLVNRPFLNTLMTGPVLFRCVELGKPTTLIDEGEVMRRTHGDAGERANDLTHILNEGHSRGGRIRRLMPWKKTYRVQSFDVFAPVAVALNGSLLPTLMSRSISIHLTRKLVDEPVDEIDAGDEAFLLPLRQMASRIRRFCDDHVEQIVAHRPEKLTGVGNRMADNWNPLRKIAHVAGWGGEAGAVLITRAQSLRHVMNAETATQLLDDIRRVFDGRQVDADRIKTWQLRNDLNGMEDRPWGDYNKGMGITQRWIATVLRPYGISPEPRALRFSDGLEARGYLKSSFENAWKRFLPPPSTSE